MKSLYFIAIIPPEDISQEITAFKQHIATSFDSVAALRTMPHITLIAPFSYLTSQQSELVEMFASLPINAQPFELELLNFGAFANNKRPVIFVNPVPNAALTKLQQDVGRALSETASVELSGNDRDFHPHITIGFKDLARANFEKAWEVYSNAKYNRSFTVNAIHLLHHIEKKWSVIATVAL